MRILVIGGVAVGASFATRMRRLSEEHEITIYEKSSYISYANCGLPYNLSGKIERERLILESPESLKEKFNVDVFVKHEVLSIDTKNKTIKVRNISEGIVFEDRYDKLVLGTGTRSNSLNIEGINAEKNVFTLKNIDDLDLINGAISNLKPKNIVVFGAGFIGLEVAEQLIEKGYSVSVIEYKNSILKLDKDFSSIVEKELIQNGVNLILNARTKKVDANEKRIYFEDGKWIAYDLIISAAGIKPNTEFIKEAGINVDDKGIVITNENMLTSDKDIYAAGDIVYSTHAVTNEKVYSPLAWGANRQAKVIANHIEGIKDSQPKTLQTAIIKMFNYVVAQTGLTEDEAKFKKIEYDTSIISANAHAGYYPGAQKVNVKLIYDINTLKVLGAQAIGMSADKKIDIIATAIMGNLTLYDLHDLNLSYSPPYGSAKDVINVVASVGINKVERKIETIKASNISDLKGTKIIDVRPRTVFEIGSVPGAVNHPLEELRNNKIDFGENETIHLICNTGHQSYNALSILRGLGYIDVRNIEGGYNLYKAQEDAYNLSCLKCKFGEDVSQKNVKDVEMNNNQKIVTANQKEVLVDCSGLSCPGPLLKLHKALEEGKDGEIFKVIATDFGFKDDIETWVVKNGHTLLEIKGGPTVEAIIMKGRGVVNDNTKALASIMTKDKDKATIVLFSGDYDKLIASLIIAQAAASLGKKVTIFATFWGLNALRTKPSKKPKKKFMKKMFGIMMPNGAEKLELSKMNMMGMGKKIIKGTMKKHNVKKPSEMIKDAMELGVEFIACTMSMDLLGITKEELIKGTTFAGVAKYISNADDSNITLFI